MSLGYLASIFRAAWLGRTEGGAGRLLVLIVVDGYDSASVVASVGRAFQAGGVLSSGRVGVSGLGERGADLGPGGGDGVGPAPGGVDP